MKLHSINIIYNISIINMTHIFNKTFIAPFDNDFLKFPTYFCNKLLNIITQLVFNLYIEIISHCLFVSYCYDCFSY